MHLCQLESESSLLCLYILSGENILFISVGCSETPGKGSTMPLVN